eukprot:164977-Rhodomonas_salina.1
MQPTKSAPMRIRYVSTAARRQEGSAIRQLSTAHRIAAQQQRARHPLRNQTHNRTISVRFVPGMCVFVFDFGPTSKLSDPCDRSAVSDSQPAIRYLSTGHRIAGA